MKTILWLGFLAFLVLFGAYLVVEFIPPEQLGGVDRARAISDRIVAVGREAWDFGRPLLQLIAVLAILQWLFERLGFSFDWRQVAISWDVRALLALIVVGAFSIAALASAPGMGVLQDVALVVVGFYFGELKRTDSKSSEVAATVTGTSTGTQSSAATPDAEAK